MDAFGFNLAMLVAQLINLFILFFFLAVIVGGGIWLVRRLQRQTYASEAPVDLLNRRLAAGDIDEETYERLRQKIAGE